MAPGAVTSKGTPSGGGTSGLPVDFGGILDSICGLAFCGIWIIVPIMIIIGILGGSRKNYGSPTLSMNGMGVNQNLDPVEAAMLLRDDPRRILTMIMFGLMKKGNVKLISTEPLRLQLVARKDLNYYEALFADAIKGDMLNEDKLLTCFKALAQRVVDKTRPYSRKETEAFYRKKIDDAWNDVKALDTPELKLQKYDTNMFWLMADEQFASKTQDCAARRRAGTRPRSRRSTGGTPTTSASPTEGPGPSTGTSIPGGSQPTNQTTSSVESFAKNITNSVEKIVRRRRRRRRVVPGRPERGQRAAGRTRAITVIVVRRQRLRVLRLRLRIVRLCLCLCRGRRGMHMKTAKINNMRLHLREEKDGTGLLVINASHVLYLDKIGTDFVKHYLRYTRKKPLVGSVRDNVVLRMMTKYKVSRKKAGQDYDRLMDSIWGIIAGNTCPFTTLRRQGQGARLRRAQGAAPHRPRAHVPL